MVQVIHDEEGHMYLYSPTELKEPIGSLKLSSFEIPAGKFLERLEVVDNEVKAVFKDIELSATEKLQKELEEMREKQKQTELAFAELTSQLLSE